MSSETRKETRQYAQSLRSVQLQEALHGFSSNLYGLLVKKPFNTRYLKILKFPDGHWLAIAGITNAYGEPLVAFGNGKDFVTALESVGKAMASGRWKQDKYAKAEK